MLIGQYNEHIDKGMIMAEVGEPTNRELIESMVTRLERAPKNHNLAEFGITFTKQPLRDIGTMAWLLALGRDHERTDRFLVVEHADVVGPGCGHRPQLTASVKRLVVDMRHGVMRLAHEHTTPYNRTMSRMYGAEDLTAYHFLASCARTPQLMTVGMGDTPNAQIQALVEERLYQVADGIESPLTKVPALIEANNFDSYPGMEAMVSHAALMERHVQWVAVPVE